MSRLDEIERTWKDNLAYADDMTVDDGSKAMANDVLALVAVAKTGLERSEADKAFNAMMRGQYSERETIEMRNRLVAAMKAHDAALAPLLEQGNARHE